MTIHNEKHIVDRIKELSIMLGSQVDVVTCCDHTGSQWKKIVIEYDKIGKDEKDH